MTKRLKDYLTDEEYSSFLQLVNEIELVQDIPTLDKHEQLIKLYVKLSFERYRNKIEKEDEQ